MATILEPCQAYIGYWDLDGKQKNSGTSPKVFDNHAWGGWTTLKELACHSKDGYQLNLQERECVKCGLLQQRKVGI